MKLDTLSHLVTSIVAEIEAEAKSEGFSAHIDLTDIKEIDPEKEFSFRVDGLRIVLRFNGDDTISETLFGSGDPITSNYSALADWSFTFKEGLQESVAME